MADIVGQVRLLISDTATDPSEQLLSDYQIEELLGLVDGSVFLAAAQCLEIIATSETLVSKKIRTQDLQTDGPAVAALLRSQAAMYRDQADDGVFEVFDFDPCPNGTYS